jgi:hypothetical protein
MGTWLIFIYLRRWGSNSGTSEYYATRQTTGLIFNRSQVWKQLPPKYIKILWKSFGLLTSIQLKTDSEPTTTTYVCQIDLYLTHWAIWNNVSLHRSRYSAKLGETRSRDEELDRKGWNFRLRFKKAPEITFWSLMTGIRTIQSNINKLFILPYSVFVFCMILKVNLLNLNWASGVCNRLGLCSLYARYWILI